MPFSSLSDLGGATLRGSSLRALAALVGLNLAMLVWALSTGQGIGAVLVFYWMENVALGVGMLLRILMATTPLKSRLNLAAFFFVHYGVFSVAHGMVLVNLFPDLVGSSLLSPAMSMGLFLVAQIAVFGLFLPILDKVTGIALDDPQKAMIGIYGRVVVIHVAILAMAGLIKFSGTTQAVGMLFVLVAAKIIFDTRFQPAAADPKGDAA